MLFKTPSKIEYEISFKWVEQEFEFTSPNNKSVVEMNFFNWNWNHYLEIRRNNFSKLTKQAYRFTNLFKQIRNDFDRELES